MNPKQIDEWLKKKDKSREWLAEQLSVSPNTARGWFSCRPIPKRKLEKIRSLMEEEAAEEASILEFRSISFVASKTDEEAMRKVAEMQGKSLEDFVRETILQCVHARLHE